METIMLTFKTVDGRRLRSTIDRTAYSQSQNATQSTPPIIFRSQ